MQNVNIRMDARTDGWTDGRMDRKTKTIYPSTYFVCRGYNHVSVSLKDKTKLSYSVGVGGWWWCVWGGGGGGGGGSMILLSIG